MIKIASFKKEGWVYYWKIAPYSWILLPSNTNHMQHSNMKAAYQVSRKLIVSIPNGNLLDVAVDQTVENS